jgi:hypothetical protein
MLLDDFLVDDNNIPLDIVVGFDIVRTRFLTIKKLIEKQEPDYKKYYQRQYKELEKDVLNFLVPIGIFIKNI